MKNIVVLDTGKEWGGGINSLLEYLKRSDRLTYSFTVLLYRDLPKGTASSLIAELASLGIKTIVLQQERFSLGIRLLKVVAKAVSFWDRELRSRLLFRLELRFRIQRNATRISQVLQQLGADLLYTNNQPSSNLEGYLAARNAGVPVVQHCRKVTRLNMDEIAATNTILSRMICVSAGLRDDYVQQGITAEKCRVVANGIDLSAAPEEASAAVRARFGISPDTVLLGFVGSFLPVKRLSDLLEALAILGTETDGSFKCLLVGDGPQRELLQRRSEALGLRDRVVFAGFQADPLCFINAMDIFLLTSEREGMPRVILEAMLLGKPVVASEVTGSAELVLDGVTGKLFPMGKPDQCAEALSSLIADSELRRRMGEAGSERVRQHYSIGSYVSGVEQVFAEVLVSAGGAAVPEIRDNSCGF
ncbi:MAG TPA: glycosyltransferase [Geobacteraceae bacterium]